MSYNYFNNFVAGQMQQRQTVFEPEKLHYEQKKYYYSAIYRIF